MYLLISYILSICFPFIVNHISQNENVNSCEFAFYGRNRKKKILLIPFHTHTHAHTIKALLIRNNIFILRTLIYKIDLFIERKKTQYFVVCSFTIRWDKNEGMKTNEWFYLQNHIVFSSSFNICFTWYWSGFANNVMKEKAD